MFILTIISCCLQLDYASTQGYVSYVSVNVPGHGYAFNYATFPTGEEQDSPQENPAMPPQRENLQSHRSTHVFPSQETLPWKYTKEVSQHHNHNPRRYLGQQTNNNYQEAKPSVSQQNLNTFSDIRDEIARRGENHRRGRHYSSNRHPYQKPQAKSNTHVLQENPHSLNNTEVPLQYNYSHHYHKPVLTVRQPQSTSKTHMTQDNSHSLTNSNIPRQSSSFQYHRKPAALTQNSQVNSKTELQYKSSHPKVRLTQDHSQHQHTTTQSEQEYSRLNDETHQKINDVQISSHRSKQQYYPSSRQETSQQVIFPTTNDKTLSNDRNQQFTPSLSVDQNQKPVYNRHFDQNFHNKRMNFDKQGVPNRQENTNTCCGVIPTPNMSSNSERLMSTDPTEKRSSTAQESSAPKQILNQTPNPFPFQSQLAVSRTTDAELGKVSSSPNDTKPIQQLDPELVSQLIRMMQASRKVSPNPQITGHIPIPAANSSQLSSPSNRNNRTSNETKAEENGNNGDNGKNNKASSIQDQTSPGKLFYPFLHLNFNLLHVVNDGEPEIHVYPMIKTTIDTDGAT